MPSPGEALDIRYVRNGDVSIAYHVVGDAPTDLVLVPDFFSNLVYDWEAKHWRPFYERLAQSFRLILFDKRGTGLSDRGPLFPNLETRMEDVRAVLDAVGSQRAVIFGGHEGSTMACLYAATYPERTVALVLWQAAAFESRTQPDVEQELLRLRDGWGTLDYAGEMLEEICPTLAENPAEREWFANRMRVGASPAAGYALNRMWSETDLRDILSAIHVPTLVMARGDIGEQEAGPVVERIRNSRYVRIPGDDYWGMFLSPEIVEEIERFVDTLEHAPEPETVLATILFTDLVGSSERATELGDRRVGRATRSSQRHDQTAARTVPRRRDRHRRRRVLRELRRTGPGDPLRSRYRRAGARARPRGSRRRSHRRMRDRLREADGNRRQHRSASRCRRRRGRGARDRNRQRPRGRLGHLLRGPRRARAEGRGALAPLLCGECLTH